MKGEDAKETAELKKLLEEATAYLKSTGKIWDYFIGNRPLPGDFFNGEYDLKYGRAFFDDKPAPDRPDGCPCP
jgi:hypothetical protein